MLVMEGNIGALLHEAIESDSTKEMADTLAMLDGLTDRVYTIVCQGDPKSYTNGDCLAVIRTLSGMQLAVGGLVRHDQSWQVHT